MNCPIRVLYSFPHKLGAERVCTTAWHQVNGLAAAGASVFACPGGVKRKLAHEVVLKPTLARGRFRIPYKLLGRKLSCSFHDWVISRRLAVLADKIDVVHTWPLGARQTLKVAKRLGIPTVLERPNAHTRFAYEVVAKECQKLGVQMPANHEHAYNTDYLQIEEEEYQLADFLLCPSDFVVKTFVDLGFSERRLKRHQYGFDEKVYYPGTQDAKEDRGLNVIFVGGCAPRKGVHYALDAWAKSTARRRGRLRIVGGFIPHYKEKLEHLLQDRSVELLGFRSDVPELMRLSDVLVLPTIEEGSALVTSEARGAGCVLLVSEASGAICRHMENGLIHRVGDVDELAGYLNLLDQDRALVSRLRSSSLASVSEATWAAAGRRLLQVYQEVVSEKRGPTPRPAVLK